jgi:hypothetical protein
MRYLTGQSYPFDKWWRGRNSMGSTLAEMRSAYDNSSYVVPGGMIVGGNDPSRTAYIPSVAITRGMKVWYFVMPDPNGERPPGATHRSTGRRYEISGQAADILLLAATTGADGFRGRESGGAWLREVMTPGMIGEIERMVRAQNSAQQRVESASQSSKAAQETYQQGYENGGAPGPGATTGIPWLPIAVVGAGVLLYLRR